MTGISSSLLAQRLLDATYHLEYESIMTLTPERYSQYWHELDRRGEQAPYDCVVPMAYARGPYTRGEVFAPAF